MSQNSLQKKLWEELLWFNGNLDDNDLAERVDKMSDVEKEAVKVLSLDGNKLINPWPTLFKLQNLWCLYLQRNHITCMTPEITRLSKLDILFMSNNNVSRVPLTLSQLRRLRWFYIGGNPVAEQLAPYWDLKHGRAPELRKLLECMRKATRSARTWKCVAQHLHYFINRGGRDLVSIIEKMVESSWNEPVWQTMPDLPPPH